MPINFTLSTDELKTLLAMHEEHAAFQHERDELRDTLRLVNAEPFITAMRRIDKATLAKVSRAVLRPASVRRLMLCASCMQGNCTCRSSGPRVRENMGEKAPGKADQDCSFFLIPLT